MRARPGNPKPFKGGLTLTISSRDTCIRQDALQNGNKREPARGANWPDALARAPRVGSQILKRPEQSQAKARVERSHDRDAGRTVLHVLSRKLSLVPRPADRTEHGPVGRSRDRRDQPYRSSPEEADG